MENSGELYRINPDINFACFPLLDEEYEIDEGFNLKKLAERSFGVFQEEPFEVEWLFDKSAAEEVLRYEFHPNQTVVEMKTAP